MKVTNMTRYQISYSKRGIPLSIFLDDRNNACRMAVNLEKAGYIVNMVEHTKDVVKDVDYKGML